MELIQSKIEELIIIESELETEVPGCHFTVTPDGLKLICAAYENDPEKIGIHMLEMLTKFRNEGIVEENARSSDFT